MRPKLMLTREYNFTSSKYCKYGTKTSKNTNKRKQRTEYSKSFWFNRFFVFFFVFFFYPQAFHCFQELVNDRVKFPGIARKWASKTSRHSYSAALRTKQTAGVLFIYV